MTNFPLKMAVELENLIKQEIEKKRGEKNLGISSTELYLLISQRYPSVNEDKAEYEKALQLVQEDGAGPLVYTGITQGTETKYYAHPKQSSPVLHLTDLTENSGFNVIMNIPPSERIEPPTVGTQ